MSEHSDSKVAPAPSDSGMSAKAPWHAPTMEEVDYSATEAGGPSSPFYDMTAYSSTFP